MDKRIAVVILLAFALVGGLVVNIAIHEAGHWTVAEFYDFNPEIHLEPDNLTSARFLMNGEPIIYTSYQGGQSSPKQDMAVAFAGPLVNLAYFFSIVGAYVLIPKKKKNIYIDLLFVALAVPAIISAIGNLIPFPGSDGWIIYNKLL